jgi:SurA N-terminal domain
LVGCGGSPRSGEVVAHVGQSAITKAALNHWMSILAGGDFYETSEITTPKGLVSEPPRYDVCVADLKMLVARGSSTLASAQLATKCHQLHQALKEQALSYLIASQTLIGEDVEQDLNVSEGEVDRDLRRLKAEQFPTEAEYRRYLQLRGWSRADERYLVRRNLLSSKLLRKLQRSFSSEQGFARYVADEAKKWTEKTTCAAGYVVEGCRQYDPMPKQLNPAPAVLIEEIARLRRPKNKVVAAPDVECTNKGKKVSCEPTGSATGARDQKQRPPAHAPAPRR